MKRLTLSLIPLLVLSGCGQSGEKTAQVVQAATRGVAEAGQQLAEKAAELAQLAPEAARVKAQELLDAGARLLQEVKDSETAQMIAVELERLLEKLAALGRTIAEKLDLAALQRSVTDLIEKFRNDPRVVSALEAVRERLKSFVDDEGR